MGEKRRINCPKCRTFHAISLNEIEKSKLIFSYLERNKQFEFRNNEEIPMFTASIQNAVVHQASISKAEQVAEASHSMIEFTLKEEATAKGEDISRRPLFELLLNQNNTDFLLKEKLSEEAENKRQVEEPKFSNKVEEVSRRPLIDLLLNKNNEVKSSQMITEKREVLPKHEETSRRPFIDSLFNKNIDIDFSRNPVEEPTVIVKQEEISRRPFIDSLFNKNIDIDLNRNPVEEPVIVKQEEIFRRPLFELLLNQKNDYESDKLKEEAENKQPFVEQLSSSKIKESSRRPLIDILLNKNFEIDNREPLDFDEQKKTSISISKSENSEITKRPLIDISFNNNRKPDIGSIINDNNNEFVITNPSVGVSTKPLTHLDEFDSNTWLNQKIAEYNEKKPFGFDNSKLSNDLKYLLDERELSLKQEQQTNNEETRYEQKKYVFNKLATNNENNLALSVLLNDTDISTKRPNLSSDYYPLGIKLKQKLNLKETGNHIISYVEPHSIADQAGVRPNSILIKLNEVNCEDKTQDFVLFYLNYLLRKNNCYKIELLLHEELSIPIPTQPPVYPYENNLDLEIPIFSGKNLYIIIFHFKINVWLK